MRFITFNVNGLRAMFTKTKSGQRGATVDNHCLQTLIEDQTPDVLCLQEVKLSTRSDIAGLEAFAKATGYPYVYVTLPTQKKGYSGVALLSRIEPEWVLYGMEEKEDGAEEKKSGGGPIMNEEGRIIRAKINGIIVVGVYVPNAQPGLARIAERIQWEEALHTYVAGRIAAGEPILVCGDMNVAPEDCDIHRKQPRQTPGASVEERDAFHRWAAEGMADAYRVLHPDATDELGYTYWSHFANARARNRGWRIDLYLISQTLVGRLRTVQALQDYHGSDHCPVVCDIADPEISLAALGMRRRSPSAK
jgi:exodeoxyribonuclease-3